MPRASDAGGKSTTVSKAEKRDAISMRLLALLDMGIEEIGKRRDPVKALVEAWDKDPLAFLERMKKLVDPVDEQGKSGNTLNFNGLFGLVAKQAAEQPMRALPPATDAEYTEVGVQAGYNDTQPIDTEW
jgi:hypothetical protein